MVLYAAGTALNDVFDLEIDRAERPGRPLPSGRVSAAVGRLARRPGAAGRPGAGLASGSVVSGIVAAILAGCILAYDAGLKHTPLGPVFMGACRGLNLLLGMSHAPELGGPIAWWRRGRLWPLRRRDHRGQPLGDAEARIGGGSSPA